MKTMLVLNLMPELEEDMVDFLLANPHVGGFTSYRTRGHGEHANMSLAEQVSGRRRRLQFEVILEEAAISELVGGLAEGVGKDILYWQQAISNLGKV
ncbi:MAG TPA: DUF3240 domain-containing protein [Gammaproteobacteria bacterium]|jgi:hypothetical protein|nr:DUF3240 family protein [Gammaproteobacteria bacterium]MDP6734290.1 DUF3240 family protein [Gammaproteobacteria bacterium]HAJ76735.1 DUF3240 domain-containing protein [Gammaproteobacteria bacterium]|tara:strand:+ start:1025 stop:1315 length:291 start_codon:yes stop_codon:yes gene_type:complete